MLNSKYSLFASVNAFEGGGSWRWIEQEKQSGKQRDAKQLVENRGAREGHRWVGKSLEDSHLPKK